MKNEEKTWTLFGINLTSRPICQQFLICSSGFFFGYLVNGICEEYVYNRLQFSYGWYFTFVQGFVYLILLRLQCFITKHMVNPWKTYLKLSVVIMGSHGLTKGSLAWLNYPADVFLEVVNKDFIPGLRRKYPPHEYIAAILLVIGLIMFTLYAWCYYGYWSLIMDAFLGNLQEAIFTMNPEASQVTIELVHCLPHLSPCVVVESCMTLNFSCCRSMNGTDRNYIFTCLSVSYMKKPYQYGNTNIHM
ncbi:hypothetical protein MKX01_016730, partial [Papaver californicum]